MPHAGRHAKESQTLSSLSFTIDGNTRKAFHLEDVSKTLYIPLAGKALVSAQGIILDDPDAECIWTENSFSLGSRSKSKWLAYFMAMRARVYDDWVRARLEERADSTVLHIGCGLDSRANRLGARCEWYDMDLGSVITERRRHFQESKSYHMIVGDVTEPECLRDIPQSEYAVVVMEGVAMYLKPESLRALLVRIQSHFGRSRVLMDVYTPFGAKASSIRNPINEVGNVQVFGIASPNELLSNEGISFVAEHSITPPELVDELRGFERVVFKSLYAGSVSRKAYRMYEYDLVRLSQDFI